MTPPLAISLGDPAGVGPELIAQAWARRVELNLPPFFVVGGGGVMAAAARTRGLDLAIAPIAAPHQAGALFANALPILGRWEAAYTPGAPDVQGARLALVSLIEATALALRGEAGGVVTAPIAKARLTQVGFTFPGQTEFLADACGVTAQRAVMMLAGPSLRTVPLTVHVALAAVPGLITTALIVSRARVVAAGLARDFGIAHPRLAIAALNPHAGEGGLMGDEEARTITPAITALANEGITVTGPHPADALFAPRARGTYDAALCMYHDQALIPLKALDFDSGVNVTLGLPIVRTSPDHGTAFGIAGRGIADPGAMVAAIRMAAACAARRVHG